MITAERLEELIKQGATIYYAYENGCVKTIDLSYGISKFKIGKNYVERKIIGTGFTERYITNKFFETKERAEWYYKMTSERTERFEPPLWEDIENYYVFEFFDKNSIGRINRLSVEKRGNHPRVYIMSLDYIKPATKENYIKACEIVRDLFNKGGVM